MDKEVINRRKAISSAFTMFKKFIKEGMAEDKSALVKCSKCGKEFTTVAKSKIVERNFSEVIVQHNSHCSTCREKLIFNSF